MQKSISHKIILLFTFIALFSLSLGFSQEKNQNIENQNKEDIKKSSVKLPIINMEIPIQEKHKTPILIAVILIVLVYYVPRAFIALKESMSQVRFNRTFLEMERMKYEILKLRYEVEALRKTHNLKEITLPHEMEQKIEDTVIKPAKAKVERKKQIILQQQKEIDSRERFVFRRLFAFFLDYFLYFILLTSLTPILNISEVFTPYFPLITGIAFILYFLVMWTTRGATVGKMIMGLKIVKLDGSSLTFKDAIIRFIVWIISNSFFALGFFWILWDKQKQSLYDMAAKTLVVRVREKREP